MPLPLASAALPTLLALTPLPSDAFVPFVPPASQPRPTASQSLVDSATVETFDPIGRAALIASQIPRQWSGSYGPFDGGKPVPVELEIASASSAGQMVVLAGRIRVDGVESAVQGNLNAKSDQLDLLVLGDTPGPGLDAGGFFQGLQGMNLSGWNPDRLTAMGGRLQLVPVPGSARSGAKPAQSGAVIRGLW
jgi:hypothetical protein